MFFIDRYSFKCGNCQVFFLFNQIILGQSLIIDIIKSVFTHVAKESNCKRIVWIIVIDVDMKPADMKKNCSAVFTFIIFLVFICVLSLQPCLCPLWTLMTLGCLPPCPPLLPPVFVCHHYRLVIDPAFFFSWFGWVGPPTITRFVKEERSRRSLFRAPHRGQFNAQQRLWDVCECANQRGGEEEATVLTEYKRRD